MIIFHYSTFQIHHAYASDVYICIYTKYISFFFTLYNIPNIILPIMAKSTSPFIKPFPTMINGFLQTMHFLR